jgi:hypothetical protein
VTPQRLKDGKNPIYCAMWWRKHLKVGGKKERLGVLTIKDLHLTSNTLNMKYKNKSEKMLAKE